MQVDRAHYRITARQARGAELDALWTRLDASYSYYADYRLRTSREIPVVVLERAG